jgi:hypothetical protein
MTNVPDLPNVRAILSRSAVPHRETFARSRQPVRLEDLSGQNRAEGIASLWAPDRWHDR